MRILLTIVLKDHVGLFTEVTVFNGAELVQDDTESPDVGLGGEDVLVEDFRCSRPCRSLQIPQLFKNCPLLINVHTCTKSSKFERFVFSNQHTTCMHV